jgi:hypothetical protein
MSENALMAAVQVQNYLSRARDFLEGMNFLKDDLAFSSALLGIHCALSYCDALRIGLGSVKVSSDDHGSASEDLKERLTDRRFENLRGVDHLRDLLSKKSRIAYAPDAVRKHDFELIVKHTERFVVWAEETGKRLRIEGW